MYLTLLKLCFILKSTSLYKIFSIFKFYLFLSYYYKNIENLDRSQRKTLNTPSESNNICSLRFLEYE